ncbi:uncharacterized protein V1510DRAFT_362907 [Dipodascopsis tothii]|uniref:uncharacterized protein n=1 Tax=Dipodascopsis tothii TaxID=44089 RepID=UPI0034CEA04B
MGSDLDDLDDLEDSEAEDEDDEDGDEDDEDDDDDEEDADVGDSMDEDEDDEDEDDSDSASDSDAPQVVRFDGSSTVPVAAPSKRERKAFMSATAPKRTLSAAPAAAAAADDDDDRANLKNDLALQRLITESHILHEAQRKGGASLSTDFLFNPTGKARLKTLDARIESLAALHGGNHRNAAFKRKQSDPYSLDPAALISSDRAKFNKQKMPMQMRKGIVGKAAERAESRERHARESGIVLPKGITKKKGKPGRRERSLTVNGVGHFTRGGLVISKKEHAQTLSRH